MIAVEHLTKYYGDFLAVKDLSFEIPEGHVYGFLGPNGAGKSTTMNIMTGCLSATAGYVRINGHDIFEEPEEAKKCIGYLPEQPPLYMNETPEEYLRFVGEAKGLRGRELREQMEDVIRQTGIEEVRGRIIAALSKGYRQRVGIAQALLGNPDVIILDEPTVGLDPIQIIEIRELIGELGRNHTVILSSHILSEVQAICEKVLIISKGKLVAYDTPDNLETLMSSSGRIRFTVEADLTGTRDVMGEMPELTGAAYSEKDDGTVEVEIQTGDDSREIRKRLFYAFAGREIPIIEMTAKKMNLEQVFIELTEDADRVRHETAAAAEPDGETDTAAAAEPDGETETDAAAEPDGETDTAAAAEPDGETETAVGTESDEESEEAGEVEE